MAEKRASRKGERRKVAPSTWALIGSGAITLLLLHAGYSSGNWRGVWVSEVQVLVVTLVAYLGLRD
jgi:hypothetical protein